MRCLIFLLYSCVYAADLPPSPVKNPVSLELDLFGKSYHTNRNYDWNETNPGAGIGIAYADSENADLFASFGSYKDSYSKQAFYGYVGLRGVFGDRDGLHFTAAIAGGYLNGSGGNGPSIIPIISIGYYIADICAVADPFVNDSTKYSHGEKTATSKMIAAFLKIRVFTF